MRRATLLLAVLPAIGLTASAQQAIPNISGANPLRLLHNQDVQKDLPKAVTDALDKAAPGAPIEKARAFEIRASLRFGALEKPKVYYTVRVEKDGQERTLNVKPGGDLIQKFEFPKKK